MSKHTEERPKVAGWKKALGAASTVLLILCTALCFLVVLQTALKKEANLFGYRLFYVVTGSMEPTIPVNSMLVVKAKDSYEVGDVVTFMMDSGPIAGHPNTHRIIAKSEESGVAHYVTQGDANNAPDSGTITHADIVGSVRLHLPPIGLVSTLIQMLGTAGGFFALILLPFLAIAVGCMREFKKALDEDLRQRAKASLEAELAMSGEEDPPGQEE